MTGPETDAMLEQFAELAELGVGAEAYAFARGMPLAELERACQARWGLAAQAVAERMRREPARLLMRMSRLSNDDPKLAARLLSHVEWRADRDRAPTADTSPIRVAIESIERLRADPATRDHLRAIAEAIAENTRQRN